MREYLKYYNLERYLEKDVYSFFHANHYLTAEQFFAVIFWKSRFTPTHVGALDNAAVSELTKRIFEASSPLMKLQVLLGDNQGQGRIQGFRLAVASALLTILYPDDFTVY